MCLLMSVHGSEGTYAEEESLPDYPALRQAQNALWRIGEVHGAAVMIGAGFSQFADRTADTTPLAPLWSDFQEAMLHELYPEGGGPSDPLALAAISHRWDLKTPPCLV